jgi:tRNA threonylcarbamoyladenosine biosynthesis protein TsaE
MATFISRSPDETFALGERWGRAAAPGWVIGLTGDLGAGKTQLVKGLARGLGITARVQSPTFALVNEYHGGRLPLAHLDLYRLDTPEQIIGAGLEPYFDQPPGVTVIEWCERWPGFHASRLTPHGSRLRLVRLTQTAEAERRIDYEDPGD